jgi:type 1 fimbriae regulatory protein FimB
MIRQQPMNAEQRNRLIETAKSCSKRDYLIAVLLTRHAMRCTELRRLKVSQIDLRNGYITVKRLKGSISAVEELQPGDREALEQYLQHHTSALLFPGRDGQPLTRQQMYNIYRRLTERAGLPAQMRAPHSARHTIGQLLADSGATAKEIQQVFGHKSLASTGQYFQHTQQHIDNRKRMLLFGEAA